MYFEPSAIRQLADVLEDVCRTVERVSGSTDRELKEMLGKRILAAFAAGLTDPIVLKTDAMSCVLDPRTLDEQPDQLVQKRSGRAALKRV